MKKLIKIFLSVLIIIFLLVLYMDYNDYKYVSKLEAKIIKHTDIKKINYINTYGKYYIVLDADNLYVFDNKYVELLKIDRILIHPNTKKYDIIYDEKPIYIKDYYKDNKLYYEYYDLYSYEKVSSILVGGSYE